jgi:hypothetical protein
MTIRCATLLVTIAAGVLGAVDCARAQTVPIAPRAAIRGFSIVLVLGTESSQTPAGDLPPGATRALADLRAFLPYRSYRLLDSVWVLSPGSGRATARLRGMDERHYEVTLDSMLQPSRVGVKFLLREADSRTQENDDSPPHLARISRNRAEAARLEDELRRLRSQLPRLGERLSPSHPDVMVTKRRIQQTQTELDALQARLAQVTASAPVSSSQVIDTGFAMDVGETVVVGTSRLQGSDALIVLLTAVPAKP